MQQNAHASSFYLQASLRVTTMQIPQHAEFRRAYYAELYVKHACSESTYSKMNCASVIYLQLSVMWYIIL